MLRNFGNLIVLTPIMGGERQGGWGERNVNVTSKFQRKLRKTMFLILPQAEILDFRVLTPIMGVSVREVPPPGRKSVRVSNHPHFKRASGSPSLCITDGPSCGSFHIVLKQLLITLVTSSDVENNKCAAQSHTKSFQKHTWYINKKKQ